MPCLFLIPVSEVFLIFFFSPKSCQVNSVNGHHKGTDGFDSGIGFGLGSPEHLSLAL